MANFGFPHLSVVAPYPDHWREARSAVGAPELLQQASESSTLAEAVGRCTLVVGTGTVEHRIPEQECISLPDLAPRVQNELARGGRVALVFGSEKRGLTRGDLSRCQLLVAIPTTPRQPSMNLGQAVAVCLYELNRIEDAELSVNAPHDRDKLNADTATLDRLAGLIEQTMAEAKYSPQPMEAANAHDVRLLLRRLRMNEPDARRVLGFFRRILWQMEHLK